MECICQSLSLIINFCHSEQGNISTPDPLWFDLPRHLRDRRSNPSFRSHSQHFAGSATVTQCSRPRQAGWYTWVCACRLLEAQPPVRGLLPGPRPGALLLINYWERAVLPWPLAELRPKCKRSLIWRVFFSSHYPGTSDYQPSSHWLYSYDLFSILWFLELEMSAWIIN